MPLEVATGAQGDPEPTTSRGRSSWFWRTVRSNPSATFGLVALTVIVLMAVFAPLLAPTGLGERVGEPFGRPSSSHWLGLDDGGQDVVTLMLYGTRTTLVVGFGATILAIVIGAFLGIAAGYVGGATDTGIARVTDFFLVIPEVPLMIVIAAIWGGINIFKMILVIGLLLWTWTVRVLRAQTMSVKERVYVRRARALGAGHWRTVIHHVLPQVTPLIVVNAVLTFAVAVFDETALSFLGLGDPNRPSLGRLIEFAWQRGAVTNGAWWAIVPPGLLVALVIVSLTFIGSALEDALNPRLRVSYLSRKHFAVLPNRGTGVARGAVPGVASS